MKYTKRALLTTKKSTKNIKRLNTQNTEPTRTQNTDPQCRKYENEP